MTKISELHTSGGDVIEFSDEYQGVTLWLGDGVPVHFADDIADVDVLDLVSAPMQRAVTVARLRRLADLLDDGSAARLLAEHSRTAVTA